MSQNTELARLRKCYHDAKAALEETRAKSGPLAKQLPSLKAQLESATRDAEAARAAMADAEEARLLGDIAEEDAVGAKRRHRQCADAFHEATESMEAHSRAEARLQALLQKNQGEFDVARREYLLAVSTHHCNQARAAALESMWTALAARSLAAGGLTDLDGAFYALAKQTFERPGPTWDELVERTRRDVEL